MNNSSSSTPGSRSSSIPSSSSSSASSSSSSSTPTLRRSFLSTLISSWKLSLAVATVSVLIAIIMFTRLSTTFSSLTKTILASTTVPPFASGVVSIATTSTTASSYPNIDSPPSSRHQQPSVSPLIPNPDGTLPSRTPSSTVTPSSTLTASPKSESIHMYSRSRLVPTNFRIKGAYPHDPNAFTQGLMWYKNILIEGTGLYNGQSKIRKVTLKDQKYTVQQEKALPGNMFGEGITVWPPAPSDKGITDPLVNSNHTSTIYQLTWRESTLYCWDIDNLNLLSTNTFRSTQNQGWGLTHDGENTLIQTDGSQYLHFYDPIPTDDKKIIYQTNPIPVIDKVKPRDNLVRPSKFGPQFTIGQTVPDLNEIEYIHGWIFANIWYDARIAIIDPLTGYVVWYLNLENIVNENVGNGEDCLNGIAYTMKTDLGTTGEGKESANEVWGGRLWITGKKWHRFYELELTDMVDAYELAEGLGSARQRQRRLQKDKENSNGKDRKH